MCVCARTRACACVQKCKEGRQNLNHVGFGSCVHSQFHLQPVSLLGDGIVLLEYDY